MAASAQNGSVAAYPGGISGGEAASSIWHENQRIESVASASWRHVEKSGVISIIMA